MWVEESSSCSVQDPGCLSLSSLYTGILKGKKFFLQWLYIDFQQIIDDPSHFKIQIKTLFILSSEDLN